MPKILWMAPSTLTVRRFPPLAGRLGAGRACWAFLAAGLVAIGGYFVLPPDAQSVLFVAVGLASVVGIYLGARINLTAGDRLPWNLFALGLLGQLQIHLMPGLEIDLLNVPVQVLYLNELGVLVHAQDPERLFLFQVLVPLTRRRFVVSAHRSLTF